MVLNKTFYVLYIFSLFFFVCVSVVIYICLYLLLTDSKAYWSYIAATTRLGKFISKVIKYCVVNDFVCSVHLTLLTHTKFGIGFYCFASLSVLTEFEVKVFSGLSDHGWLSKTLPDVLAALGGSLLQ